MTRPKDPEKDYPHNPTHALGTCAKCGEEMVANVPRLWPNGGAVHKATGSFECVPPAEPDTGMEKERIEDWNRIAKARADLFVDKTGVKLSHLDYDRLEYDILSAIFCAFDLGDEVPPASKAVDGQTQNEAAYDFAPWKPPFHYDDFASCIIDSKQRKIIDIRGWGFLTGKGHEALGMPEENAEGIQDRLGEYVAKFLNDSSVGTRVSSPVDGVATEKEFNCPPKATQSAPTPSSTEQNESLSHV